MSYTKNDGRDQKKALKENGWKQSAYDESLFLKGNKTARESESKGNWLIDKVKYTNLSDSKKGGRV